MNKSNISFFEYYSQYRKSEKEPYGVENFDWQRYNDLWAKQSQMFSHAMTSSIIKSSRYRRGYNMHGLKAKEIKRFMTEWLGVDRLRGGSHINRMRNQNEINLQPHRKNKTTKRLKLTELMNSILYVDEDLKKRSDVKRKRHQEGGYKPYGTQYHINWLESSIRRFYYRKADKEGGWSKDKRFSIKFHDITSNVHDEILKFLDKITTPVNHHRIFLLPCAFQGVKGITSMKANKGKGYIPSGSGEGLLLIIPEGFSFPWCSYKDIIKEVGDGWRKHTFNPPYNKFKYSKGYGSPTFKSYQHGWGYRNRFTDFLKYTFKIFTQYSLYPGDEEIDEAVPSGYGDRSKVKNRYKKNDLLNPKNSVRWNEPKSIKHIHNIDFMSEKFIKSLSHKPFKEFTPQEYDNFYTEIKINDTFNTINYLKGVPLEGKES